MIDLHKRSISILFVVTACLVFAFPLHAQQIRWTVDGVQRKALIFPPSKPSKAATAPVVFVFHPHGGTMQAAAAEMRIQDLWPEATVVYMQGLRTRIYVDPLGLEPGWQQEPGQF